jgi:predicted benzoate:H+ symporter BenE
MGQKLIRLFWAIDRSLGGERPPTRTQKFVARHPLGIAACVALAFGGFLFALSDESLPAALVTGLVGGVLLGGIFGLTAWGERSRQRRIRRLGRWDGS